jgi:hypothetical protein
MVKVYHLLVVERCDDRWVVVEVTEWRWIAP